MHGTKSLDREDRADLDRRIIQVDCSPTQQGIAAALRRAFTALETKTCDEEFEGLLAQIH